MDEPICWPHFLLGPDEGNLDAEELSAVISVLKLFKGNKDLSSFDLLKCPSSARTNLSSSVAFSLSFLHF